MNKGLTKMTKRVPIKTHPPFQFFGDISTFDDIQKISFGWKFHVTAEQETFDNTLAILEPEVMRHSFLLKYFINPEELNSLKGTVQEGKAFTIYMPQENLTEKVLPFMLNLADILLHSIPPPSITIKEQSFHNSKFIFYRFGEYEANKTIISKTFHPLLGTIFTCQDKHKWARDKFGSKWLIGPNDELWQDRNGTSYKPQWVNDPFNILLT